MSPPILTVASLQYTWSSTEGEGRAGMGGKWKNWPTSLVLDPLTTSKTLAPLWVSGRLGRAGGVRQVSIPQKPESQARPRPLRGSRSPGPGGMWRLAVQVQHLQASSGLPHLRVLTALPNASTLVAHLRLLVGFYNIELLTALLPNASTPRAILSGVQISAFTASRANWPKARNCPIVKPGLPLELAIKGLRGSPTKYS